MRRAWLLLALCAAASGLSGQAADRAVVLGRDGVMRWKDDGTEVALFGANYVLPTASDYRAAGYLHADRKALITEDMAQFARMGWDGIRLTFWGDWEAADSAGNLLANDHLDLLDWLVARARERGIYMLFSPIQLYGSNWPDALQDTTQPGFGRHFGRGKMGTDPAAIAAQVNYLRQILEHVNPYTGVALKDEPAILFIELVNEPWHHPEDLQGSLRYLNALTDAVRATGCRKLVFYNLTQDFRIGEAIKRSKVQGLTFGWYPTGLNSGHELQGNFLRAVDDYPEMRRPDLARMPRIVYEFDTPDLRTGTLYPAMARTFRSVGTQFAAMFAYDMLQTASRNLAWQTHYLNLVYTPRKALSSVIAAEAMRRLPRGQDYGAYPGNTRFGDFRVVPDSDLAVLAARDAFLYTGSTSSRPPDPASLTRVAGAGSSPVVTYEGTGAYFLDRIRPGAWRLELYPDAVPVRDPFELPRADKIVTRALVREHPITISLPDLGQAYTVQPLPGADRAPQQAVAGQFTARPGVYLLGAAGPLDLASLPPTVNRVGLAEYHAAPPDEVPPVVEPVAPLRVLAGRDAVASFRVVADAEPDSVLLFVKPAAGGWFHRYWLQRTQAYTFSARIPAAELPEGPYVATVTLYGTDGARTYPGPAAGMPWDWNFNLAGSWPLVAEGSGTALRLFEPGTDAEHLAFSRVGDAGRSGLFQLGLAAPTGGATMRLRLPVHRDSTPLPDYTASLYVGDRVAPRGETISGASAVRIRLRALGRAPELHLGLMEDAGTTWTAPVPADTAWHEVVLPLDRLQAGRGVLLPEGFPGEWNYWVGPAAGRGGAGDRFRPAHLERLQLSVRPGSGPIPDGSVEVESVTLEFGAVRP